MNISHLFYRLSFMGVSALTASLSLSISNVLASTSQGLELPVSLSSLNGRLAQVPLPEYVCQVGVEQTNLSPPNANYKSSVTCGRGTPVRLNLNVYKANVNFSNELIYIGSNTFSCNSNPCVSPNYSRNIDVTQIFYVSASADIRGATTGVVYLEQRRASIVRPYNNRGEMYPQIQPTRTDYPTVPFPLAPFAKCCDASASFRSDVQSLYTSKGWSFPSNPYEAHHIKPIAWGGNNNTSNGVLLGSTTHGLFTRWWTAFSSRNW
jgi:hypothetical protein